MTRRGAERKGGVEVHWNPFARMWIARVDGIEGAEAMARDPEEAMRRAAARAGQLARGPDPGEPAHE